MIVMGDWHCLMPNAGGRNWEKTPRDWPLVGRGGEPQQVLLQARDGARPDPPPHVVVARAAERILDRQPALAHAALAHHGREHRRGATVGERSAELLELVVAALEDGRPEHARRVEGGQDGGGEAGPPREIAGFAGVVEHAGELVDERLERGVAGFARHELRGYRTVRALGHVFTSPKGHRSRVLLPRDQG